ncbi:MAG TPA: hypothetical protein VGE72_30535 [Azospirillum sp.]
MDITLDLLRPATWPQDLLSFLDAHRQLFQAWEERSGTVGAAEYDRAHAGLHKVLQQNVIVGWHCTRLTDRERAAVVRDGMSLPNRGMLLRRINDAVSDGLLANGIATRLKAEHEADDPHRANRIWFCFFPPRLAGDFGVGRLFRSWGGEALYGLHEDDPATGPALRRIGQPCIVEAGVPIASLRPHSFLVDKIVRRYLVHHGFRTSEPVDHEDCALHPLPAVAVRRVIALGDPDFVTLTGCNTWSDEFRLTPTNASNAQMGRA